MGIQIIIAIGVNRRSSTLARSSIISAILVSPDPWVNRNSTRRLVQVLNLFEAASRKLIFCSISRQSESSLLASRDEMRASTLLRELHAAEEVLEPRVQEFKFP